MKKPPVGGDDMVGDTTTPSAGDASVSATETPGEVGNPTSAPIDVETAVTSNVPQEVHLSLEPDHVRGLETQASVGSSSGTVVVAEEVPAGTTETDVAPEDVAVAVDVTIGDPEIQAESNPTEIVSDEDDHSQTSDGDQADDEDGTTAEERHTRRQYRKSNQTDKSVATSGYETPLESPTRSPRSSDASGAFAAAMRSPAAFLNTFTKGMSFRKEKKGDTNNENDKVVGAVDGDGDVVGSGTDHDSSLQQSKSNRERKKAKRRAKKARRRLKRLVHATNTMGAVVSAKEQTTTQLALCMQLGLTLSLKAQKQADSFTDVTDQMLTENDHQRVMEVAGAKVEDGTKLPSFRFVTHAPNRFERVRAAWGLSLPNYAESFALETKQKNTIGAGQDTAQDSVPEATKRNSQELSTVKSGHVLVNDDQELSTDGAGTSTADAPPPPVYSTTRAPHHTRRYSVGSTDLSANDSDYEGEIREEGICSRTVDQSFFGASGNVSPDIFLPKETSLRVISSSAASGKSSSWFFCSKDSRFLVKTCTAKERDVLLDILGEYSSHAKENKSTSLLPQYYGVYSIEVGSRSAHFIIMNYWFATMHEISKRFDLKGSTKGRRASSKEKLKGSAAVLKDLDFLETELKVENPLAEDVKKAIEKDVAFMERNKLIDYSMMVGLHFYDDDEGIGEGIESKDIVASHDDGKKTITSGSEGGEATSAEDTETGLKSPAGRRARRGYGSFGSGAVSHDFSPPVSPKGFVAHKGFDSIDMNDSNTLDSPAVLTGPFAEPAADDTQLQFQLRALETPFGLAYLGIIDILTQYGTAKVAENLCFGTLMCGADISCQPPEAYAKRFHTFIDRHVLKVPEDMLKADGAAVGDTRDGEFTDISEVE